MKKLIFILSVLVFAPMFGAHADWGIVDALNVAPFVPMVLDAIMSVAMGGYDFFVGGGMGIIYVLIWAALAVYIALYLVKMWLPTSWLSFFGFSGGGQMVKGSFKGIEFGQTLLKPAMRAIIAAMVLLPIRPQWITNIVVDPFLRFGALYTDGITDSIFQNSPWGGDAPQFDCPKDIVTKGYMSAESCKFLVQPVADITFVNNQIVKRGLEFVDRGLRGLVTLIPHGGQDFLNIVTGLLLIITFVSSNFFMALLIVQGIFGFGMQLILYPFNVLKFVIKGKDDQWLDLWHAFGGIIESLKKLAFTMIACAFILAVNIAIVRSLFRWNTSVFTVAAHGSATDNLPDVLSGGIGFGEHSVIWMSAVLTFFLMQRIFETTQEKLKQYSGADDKLYKNVTGDFKSLRGTAATVGRTGWNAVKKRLGI